MNKYQEYILEKLNIESEIAKSGIALVGNTRIKKYDTTKGAKEFTFDKNVIKIRQNDNYNINKYEIFVSHPAIKDVWVDDGNEKRFGEVLGERVRKIAIDFNNKSKILYVSFKNNIVDPLEIPIEYIDADKKAWDATIEQEKYEESLKTINVNFIKGDSLVNVVFNPFNERYHHAKAALYCIIADTRNAKTIQHMGDFESKEKQHYIAICDIGYGNYAIVLEQFDENGDLLFKTKQLPFSLFNENALSGRQKGFVFSE